MGRFGKAFHQRYRSNSAPAEANTETKWTGRDEGEETLDGPEHNCESEAGQDYEESNRGAVRAKMKKLEKQLEKLEECAVNAAKQANAKQQGETKLRKSLSRRYFLGTRSWTGNKDVKQDDIPSLPSISDDEGEDEEEHSREIVYDDLVQQWSGPEDLRPQLHWESYDEAKSYQDHSKVSTEIDVPSSVLEVYRSPETDDKVSKDGKKQNQNQAKPVSKKPVDIDWTLRKLAIEHITRISFRGLRLSASQLQTLSRAMATNHSCKILDLQRCGLNCEHIEILAKSLRMNRCLLVLDLSHNRIATAGARCLAANLKHNKTLRRLLLVNNPLTERGVMYLCDMMQYNLHLTNVSCAFSDVKSEEVLLRLDQYLLRNRKNFIASLKEHLNKREYGNLRLHREIEKLEMKRAKIRQRMLQNSTSSWMIGTTKLRSSLKMPIKYPHLPNWMKHGQPSNNQNHENQDECEEDIEFESPHAADEWNFY